MQKTVDTNLGFLRVFFLFCFGFVSVVTPLNIKLAFKVDSIY